jgi:hypothetical protein
LEDRDVTPNGVLHILFTMDCQPAGAPLGARGAPAGPKRWEQSARSIDGFCARLFDAGWRPTLFATPEVADAHEPLFEELAERGAEVGLYVQPQSLVGGGFSRYLGQYGREQQRSIVDLALQHFQAATGQRPSSVRSAMFSASDDTYAVLHEAGLRQGSLSNPGRRVNKHAAVWTGAPRDPHYVDAASRVREGSLPFLEIPVTTDAGQVRGGLSPDLAIENGTLDDWHRPLIAAQLGRMEAERVVFRALCFYTRNNFAYHVDQDRQALTLEAVIAHLETLRGRYDVVPVTAAQTHLRFARVAPLATVGSWDSGQP